jgi:hypothetical protein
MNSLKNSNFAKCGKQKLNPNKNTKPVKKIKKRNKEPNQNSEASSLAILQLQTTSLCPPQLLLLLIPP